MIIIPEIIVGSAIKEAFKEVRDDISVLDEWLALYNEIYLASEYGQASIESVKDFVKNNEIPVLFSWSDLSSKVPCITLSTLNFDETQEKAFIGDYGFTEDEEIPRKVILEATSVTSYDETTGWVTLPNGTPLTDVFPNYLVVDADSHEFTIIGIIDTGTQKKVNIGAFSDVPVSPISIQENLSIRRARNLTVPVNHRLLLSIHTDNAFVTKNLHYVLLYILLSQKNKFTNRGLYLSTWAASDFTKDTTKLPENVYSRSIDFYVQTFFSWNDQKSETLATSVGGKILVPKDIYPRPDGDNLTVDTEPE